MKFLLSSLLLALIGFVLLVVAGCSGGQNITGYAVVAGGNPRTGRALIRRYGCGSCHVIPGVSGANGLVGPPLTSFSRRTFIAGELPNTPENLVRWLMNPPAVQPHNAMPDLGLTKHQARDVAAYLYTLR